MKRQICKRCINDSTVKNISFDENGICNYCNAYDGISGVLHDYGRLEKLFTARIEKASGKEYDYTAAVGLSGGKDSVYVLYKLARVYHVKVKAFTLDNGFLSDDARIKIDNIVRELDVEHEYITFDVGLLKRTYKYFTNKFLSPCIACSFLGYAAMIDYASKINAGICVHGRSRPQMLRSYLPGGSDVFIEYIKSGLLPPGDVDLETLYGKVLSGTRRHISGKLAAEIEGSLMQNAKAYGYREFVPYFLYHPYDKREVIDFITTTTSWQKSEDVEHFDCLIHNAAAYIKNITARRAHIMPELSVSIREETLTRDEAFLESGKSMVARPEKELDRMCGFMGLNKQKLLFKARLYGKRWW